MRISFRWIRSASFWGGFCCQAFRYEDGTFRSGFVAVGKFQIILVGR